MVTLVLQVFGVGVTTVLVRTCSCDFTNFVVVTTVVSLPLGTIVRMVVTVSGSILFFFSSSRLSQ